MAGPRYSRRGFVVASGVATLHLVGRDGDSVVARPGSPDRDWLRRYDAVSPGTLVDVEPAHGGGWVLAGTDAAQTAGVLLGIADDGRVEWRRRLAVDRDGRIVAVTRAPEGYAVLGDIRTGDSSRTGWLAFLPAEDGQPGAPRVDDQVDAIGSTVSVRPRIYPHPDGGVVVADGYVPSHTATTRVHAFDADGSRRWRQEYEDKHILGFLVPFDGGWLVGGTSRSSSPGWLAALGPDGERRWQTTIGEGEDFDVHDAVPAGEEVTLAVSYNDTTAVTGGLVHVGADQSIRWQRRYDGFRTRVLARTTDGGYAAGGRGDVGGVRLTRTEPDGSLRWSVTADEERGGSHELFGIVEQEPDSWLLVGTHEDDPGGDPTGWAMGLRDVPEAAIATSSASPTSTPTQTSPTESPTPTPSMTQTPEPTPNTSAPADTKASPTTAATASTPGFSLSAAVGSVWAATLFHMLRRDD